MAPEGSPRGERVVGGTTGHDIGVRRVAVKHCRAGCRYREADCVTKQSGTGWVSRFRLQLYAYGQHHEGPNNDESEPCPTKSRSPRCAMPSVVDQESLGACTVGNPSTASIVNRDKSDHGVQTLGAGSCPL